MTDRSDLIRAVHAARSGTELTAAVTALDNFDAQQAAHATRQRETDLAARHVTAALTPVPLHERHTAATDWLGEDEPRRDFRTAMIAEASAWWASVPREVRQDHEELAAQLIGRAHTAASVYGHDADAARGEFLRCVSYLSQREGASGVPQIQQTIDPNNQPAPTPLPTQVFDNFAPEQNEYNAQNEGENHDSGVTSERAPMLQQLQQQDGSGSGFGGGPEKPDEHSTSMDTSNSYAEVPLGAPGEIPTSPPPAQGQQRQGSQREARKCPQCPPGCTCEGKGGDCTCSSKKTSARQVTGYSRPDAQGYLWKLAFDADDDSYAAPLHSICGSCHYPGERCTNGHTASMAVDFTMDHEQFLRVAAAEQAGAREGMSTLEYAGGDISRVAAHHNTLVASYNSGGERGLEDAAVLHGYMAVVRPVLAEGLASCSKCGKPIAPGKGKLCHNCQLNAHKDKPKTGSLAAPNFTEAAGAASRENGRKTASIPKGAPFAGYKDFDDCVSQNSGKDNPQAYCGYIKHRVEGKLSVFARLAGLPGRELIHAERELATYFARQGASQLPQIQQVTDPNNQPTPEADHLPADVMFPLNPDWQQQWQTGPGGAQPKAQQNGQRTAGSGTGTHPGTERCESCGHRPGCDCSCCDSSGHEASRRHANGYPMGDTRPAETMPTGEQVGDGDHDQWGGGDDTADHGNEPYEAGHQAARMNGLPSGAAQMFGHMDALDGKKPHHKDNYPFSAKAHGQYLRGWNANNAAMTALRGDDPMNREGYANLTGRPDLHSHWMENYDAARRVKAEREGGGTSKEGSRHQADTFSRPDQSTDQFTPPYNDQRTTPDPQSQQQDQDAQQGARDGAEDARNGERPLFADNSSQVSPYVKSYADAYGATGGGWQDPSGAPAQPDVPASMGGDSGQARNAQEAERAYQVAQGSRRTARDWSQSERDEAKASGNTLPGTDKLPIESHEDFEAAERRAHQVKGVPESKVDAYMERQRKKFGRVAASFTSPEAAASPEFAKGYGYARRWQPGARLVSQGSAAFEAGLYAGISDNPAAQGAWTAAHRRMAKRHPALGGRLQAHEEFTRKLARADDSVITRGIYVQAGTSTDLITDGPGTSPDPMGSTPLNGPGTPPPMGGKSDPAASAGPPPYQGAEPRGSGPVVPDDVMGQPQEQPQPDGPVGQGFSGPGPGYTNENMQPSGGSTDLAPGAPDTAAQPGYSNRDAYNGDPRGGDKVARRNAFRARVQAGLHRLAQDGQEADGPKVMARA